MVRPTSSCSSGPPAPAGSGSGSPSPSALAFCFSAMRDQRARWKVEALLASDPWSHANENGF